MAGFPSRVLPFLLFLRLGGVISQPVTMPRDNNLERILLSNKLALEVEYLRLYEGMSMEEGKGMGMGMGMDKGKGDGMSKDECKSNGGMMMMCSKSSKKGSMMGSKKGKGMSKITTQFPSASIVPSLCKLCKSDFLFAMRPQLDSHGCLFFLSYISTGAVGHVFAILATCINGTHNSSDY
jgi:hypothetical protein